MRSAGAMPRSGFYSPQRLMTPGAPEPVDPGDPQNPLTSGARRLQEPPQRPLTLGAASSADFGSALRQHEDRVGELLEAHRGELTLAITRQQSGAAATSSRELAGERAWWSEAMVAEVGCLRDFLGEELQKNAAAVQQLQRSVDELLRSDAAPQQPRAGRAQQPREGRTRAAVNELGEEKLDVGGAGRGDASLGKHGVGSPSLGEPASGRRAWAPSSETYPGDHARSPLVPGEGEDRAASRPSRRRSSSKRRRSQSQLNGRYMLLNQAPSFASAASEHFPQMGDHFTIFFEKLDDIWSAEEPPRTGALAEFITSRIFRVFIASAILANSLDMFCSVNHHLEFIISNGHAKEETERVFGIRTVDFCFWLLYSVELLCKLVVHGRFVFWNGDMVWNWLDFALIVRGLLDVLFHILPFGGYHSQVWVRALRILRVVRVLRVLRVLRFFSEAYSLMNAIMGSAMHLFWSLVVIAILMLIFSLHMCANVAIYLEDLDSVDGEEPQAMIMHFGSVQVCMLSLYMTITGGTDWNELYFSLAPASLGPTFLFFVAWTQLCLLNIVTGIFVEQAMKLALPDVHERASEQNAEDQRHAMTLKRLLHSADRNEEGVLHRDEFDAIVKEGELAEYLISLGVDTSWSNNSLPFLYDVVAEECREQCGGDPASDGVEIAALVGRIMALRGVARSTDIIDLRDRVWHMQNVQELVLESVGLSVDENGIVDGSGMRRLRRRRVRRDMEWNA